MRNLEELFEPPPGASQRTDHLRIPISPNPIRGPKIHPKTRLKKTCLSGTKSHLTIRLTATESMEYLRVGGKPREDGEQPSRRGKNELMGFSWIFSFYFRREQSISADGKVDAIRRFSGGSPINTE